MRPGSTPRASSTATAGPRGALRLAPAGGSLTAAMDAPARGDRAVADAGGLAVTALMFLPGALVVFMGFNAGGYFPASTALATVVLAQILLVRAVRAPRPFEGLAPRTLVAIAALALYALLTLASALWSHATGRALIEFDRAWLYLLTLVLFGTVRPSTQHLRWFVRALLLGVSIVCLAGLISRVLPDVWHTAPNVANERLSYPVTYWNALGLLAALGIVLAFHLSCTLTERRLVGVLAAALVPLLAATLFFTFSRGAMAAGAIGLAVYILVGRPRGLLSGALATLPGAVALVVVAYHANLLDTVDPTTPAAVSQGHRVALAAGVCVALCAGLRLLLARALDPRLRRSAGGPRLSRRTRRGAFVAVAAAVVVGSAALNVPHTLAQDWSRFIGGAPTRVSGGDLRQRLSDPSNNGRTDLWRVALRGFAASPLHGDGAGMYQTIWDQRRPRFIYTINAHSLYLQTMAELGVPGLLLLLIVLGAVLSGLGARASAPASVSTPTPAPASVSTPTPAPASMSTPTPAPASMSTPTFTSDPQTSTSTSSTSASSASSASSTASRRSLYGALLAAGVVWALRAGVDWDWEMPVVTLGFFAAAGLVLSPRRGSGVGWAPGRGARVALGLLCLAGAVLPVLIVGSESRLGQAERALYASNCAAAGPAALSSIGWLDVRPEPYEIVGFCDMQHGLPGQAVAAMRQAVHRDPGSWETYYALAIAQAAAGIDPRRDAERALRMNPFEPLTRQAARELRVSSPAEWVRRADLVRASALASNDLSIVPS